MIKYDDEILSIEYVGEYDLIDIDIDHPDHLFFANGILTHNSAIDESNINQAHIAGGFSKVNTADNLIAIIRISELIKQGQYVLHFLKTRAAGGMDVKKNLAYDTETMRITDLDNESDAIQQATSKSTIDKIKNRETTSKYETKPDIIEEPKGMNAVMSRLNNQRLKSNE